MNTTASGCPFANLMDPAFIANGMPNDKLKEIQDAGLAVKIDDPITGIPFWAITHKSAIDYVSTNTDIFSSALRGAPPMEQTQQSVDTVLSRMFLNMDPPKSLEYRKLISDNFTPVAVAKYKETLERVAKEVVDNVIDRGECEFVEDVAAEMPLITILALFDIDIAERKQFFDWTNVLMFADDPEFQYKVNPDAALPIRIFEFFKSKILNGYHRTRTIKASIEVFNYFKRLAPKWRGRDDDNICTQLLNGTVNGKALSDTDFAWTCLMLVTAGNESTRTAISHGMRNLMENPEQYRHLQEHPEDLDKAIDEMLRHNTSFITMRRTATQDHKVPELGNADIKKGDKVIMYYHAANYETELFGDDAEKFDIHRSDRIPRMRMNIRSFGYGKHSCMGMHLARLEMKTQFTEILKRIKNPRFAGPVTYIQSNFVQGIREMPITFEKV